MARIEHTVPVRCRRTWLFKPGYGVVKALCWLGIVHPARGASFVTKHCLTAEYRCNPHPYGHQPTTGPAPQNPPKAK